MSDYQSLKELYRENNGPPVITVPTTQAHNSFIQEREPVRKMNFLLASE